MYCIPYLPPPPNANQPMIEENRQLVTDEPVELEGKMAAVQDFKRITDHFRGIHGIYLKLR